MSSGKTVLVKRIEIHRWIIYFKSLFQKFISKSFQLLAQTSRLQEED